LLLTYPRSDNPNRLVGIVSGTGLEGMRSTHLLPYFVSGVHYPDYFVVRSSVWEEGDGKIEAAGFFNNEWQPALDQPEFHAEMTH
jgi:hypothetical protein